MATQSSRRRSRPQTNLARLHCESFESRIAPAVFAVQAPLNYSGINNYGCVAVADFDKNGFSDAVLSNYGTNQAPGTQINILYANGSGGFSRVVRSTGGNNVSYVAVGDINADTWPDVVAVNGNQNNFGSVSVFRNDGFGNLTQVGTPFSTFGKNSSWIGLEDMTGDNILDIVVSSFGVATTPEQIDFNNVTIFSGNGTKGVGNFTYSSGPITTLRPEVQFVPNALAVADFDGDGIKDIAAVSPSVPPDFGVPQTPGTIYAFRGTGSGGFAVPEQSETGGALPVGVQAADIHGDGKKDLIIANAGDPNATPEFKDNSVGVVRNFSAPGSISFGIPTSLTQNAYGVFAVAVADFDVNGTADIASINYGGQSGSPQSFVSLYLGNGTGTFLPENPGVYNIGTGFPGGQFLAVAKLDANATPDLFVATATNQVGRLVNNTAAAAAPIVTGTQINGSASAQRSRVTSLTVTFDAQVSFANNNVPAAFTITRNGGGGIVNFQATANVVGGVTVVTLNNFTGSATLAGSLVDGRYTLTALAANITANGQQLNGGGGPGTNYVFSPQGNQGFFRFFGDINGDQRVDIADFGLFSATYNLMSGQTGYNAAFDFNGDGRVDIVDFGQFSLRYFTNLP